MAEAGELLEMSERQFRRYRDRYAEDGLDGLLDGRLGERLLWVGQLGLRLAKAAASAAIDSLDRCIARLHRLAHLEADRTRLGALRPHPMAERLLGVLGHQAFELGLRPLMLEEGRPGRAEQRPGIRGSHIDTAHYLDPRPWRVDPEQARAIPEVDAAPELLLCSHQFIDFEIRIISGSLVELIGPSMDDGVTIEVIHGGHDTVLEFCLEATRIWRSTERASFEKKPSTRLSQEPCLGVKVNSKRPVGCSASQALVSLEICAE
jgi:hypothetical protein